VKISRGKIVLAALVLVGIGFAVFALTRDAVLVLDVKTGKPVAHAKVVLIHPSFTGSTYFSNSKGMVRVWEGLPWYGVEISKEGYTSEKISTADPQTRTNRLVVSLSPNQ
jgi:hypothetical protein